MESSARTASVSISVTKQHWIISSGHLSESETSKELYLTRKNSSPKKLTLPCWLKKYCSILLKGWRSWGLGKEIIEWLHTYRPKDPKTDFYTLLKSQNHFTVAAKLKALAWPCLKWEHELDWAGDLRTSGDSHHAGRAVWSHFMLLRAWEMLQNSIGLSISIWGEEIMTESKNKKCKGERMSPFFTSTTWTIFMFVFSDINMNF